MRIVHVVIGGDIAGGQMVALQLARAAREAGHDVSFVSPTSGPFLERVRSEGIRLTHLDAHKHVHAFPPIFAIVARLAERFGIPVVRVPYERWPAVWGDRQQPRAIRGPAQQPHRRAGRAREQDPAAVGIADDQRTAAVSTQLSH